MPWRSESKNRASSMGDKGVCWPLADSARKRTRKAHHFTGQKNDSGPSRPGYREQAARHP